MRNNMLQNPYDRQIDNANNTDLGSMNIMLNPKEKQNGRIADITKT